VEQEGKGGGSGLTRLSSSGKESSRENISKNKKSRGANTLT